MSATVNVGELLNLVGLSTGVVLYAMLLAMVLRARRASVGGAGVDPLLLITSILGLVWNLCALPAYELPKVGIEGPFPTLAAVGFAALGFLPAVVVHSVLRGARRTDHAAVARFLTAAAYTVSAIAALLQVYTASVSSPIPSPLAMRLLTYSFIGLVAPLAVITRGRPGAGRALWVAALATFAVSALHLSQLHRPEPAWPVELVGHHASLPLALAILYQDYRFALADLFLKRALSLLALVTVAFAAIATFGVRSTAFAGFVQSDPRQLTILVTLWVATALLYPVLRRGSVWFVDTVVLHRPDYPSLRATVAREAQDAADVEHLLTTVCGILAPALNAAFVTWRPWPSSDRNTTLGGTVVTGAKAIVLADTVRGDGLPGPPAACLAIETTDQPRFVLAVGQLGAGRRLLSDDVATLDAIGVLVARRIDAIRITNERYTRAIREQEMGKLATEAELRALRAQLNPHFLFNALTTIGYLIQTAPSRALETLLRLTALLRGVLRSEGDFTTLGRELDIVESYLEIERARFEQRLRVTVDVPAGLRSIRLPPLVLQPIVENAVKHGIARKQTGGEVTIRARLETAAGGQPLLAVTVQDTGAGASMQALERGRSTGLGLRNVARRLECLYGDAGSLTIHTGREEGTTVDLRVPVAAAPAEPVREAAS
ncbi:MAG TPA: histidine kinase [Vicinamibacterales bacterium]|nr:histidine kinase [Vicinamibacterales bacterium]